jgi:hypothetical protein
MLVTAYGAFIGRTAGSFDTIEEIFGVSPEGYAIFLCVSAFVWFLKVMFDRDVDGITLTPLLLYYTMAVFYIINTPGVSTGPLAAYVYIAADILQLIFSNNKGLLDAARSDSTRYNRTNGDNPRSNEDI